MIKIKNICIITDFDHTLTSKNSKSSWDVLELSESVPEICKKESQKNKQYYLKKEKDYNLSFSKKSKYMKEWLEKNLAIFRKCGIFEKEIEAISNKKDVMKLRKGVKDFLKYTYKENIPVIIISAGISDIIKNFLKANNILFDNIYIISNEIKYKNGKLICFKNKNIHSLNKDKIKTPLYIKTIISKKEKIILLGDNIEDTLLMPKGREEDTTKIGFLDYKQNLEEFQKNFDIVYQNGTFKEILKLIKKTN